MIVTKQDFLYKSKVQFIVTGPIKDVALTKLVYILNCACCAYYLLLK